jgi:hypothetical protein
MNIVTNYKNSQRELKFNKKIVQKDDEYKNQINYKNF